MRDIARAGRCSAAATTAATEAEADILCYARGVPHATTAGNVQFRYLPGYVVIFSNDLASRTRIVPMETAGRTSATT